MATKHMERGLILLFIWEMKIKSNWDTITYLMDWEKSKVKSKINKIKIKSNDKKG